MKHLPTYAYYKSKKLGKRNTSSYFN